MRDWSLWVLMTLGATAGFFLGATTGFYLPAAVGFDSVSLDSVDAIFAASLVALVLVALGFCRRPPTDSIPGYRNATHVSLSPPNEPEVGN